MKNRMKRTACLMLAVSLAAMPVQAAEYESLAESETVESIEPVESVEPESLITSQTLQRQAEPESETVQESSSADVVDLQESESVLAESEPVIENDVVESEYGVETFSVPTSVNEYNDISVVSRDDENGILVMKIANPNLTSEGDSIVVPVWSEKNGQDDIVWYDAEKKDDGWYIAVNVQDHNYESGVYNVHFYCKSPDGNMTLLDGVKESLNVTVVPKLEASVNGNIVNVTLRNMFALTSASKVYFPVWGNSGGQNDIVWYPAKYVSSGTWTASIDLSNHRETGTYTVHAYVDNGGMDLLLASSFNVTATISGKVSVVDKDDEMGTFTLKIEDVSAPGGVKSIMVPVWSENNGQDDIVWYEAKKDGNAWYVNVDAANHKNDVGVYNAHVYIYDNFGSSGLACYTKADVKMNTDVILTAVKNSTQTQITITLKNYNVKAAGNTIRFAVWGNENGQNDLVWYDAVKSGKNTWSYTVNLKNHQETGIYNIHVYELQNNSQLTFVNNTQCTIDGISGGTIEVSDIDDDKGTVTLLISGVTAPSGIAKIEVPVWTQKNGQDDLKWYTAVKKGNNYEVTIPRKNHNNEYGKYTAHVYVYDNFGTSKLVTYINFDVEESKEETYSCTGINIKNVDFTSGTFRVEVAGVKASSGVKSVKIPVWSELNGQDDIVWYNAKQSGDTWYVDVNTIKNHNVVKGTYLAHAYVVTNSGKEFLLGGTSTVIQWDLSWGKPGIDVSQWQGLVNWKEVKASGIEFAMIRTGYGKDNGQEDPKFEYNIKAAKENGIKVGVYHYSYADSVERAKAEAEYCLSILKNANVPLDYPVAFDIEEADRYANDKIDENTEMIQVFCDTIEAAGYDAIVYANANFLSNYVNYDEIKQYGIWMAKWTSDVTAGYGDFENVQIWQYSNNGNLGGISGAVDINVSFLK